MALTYTRGIFERRAFVWNTLIIMADFPQATLHNVVTRNMTSGSNLLTLRHGGHSAASSNKGCRAARAAGQRELDRKQVNEPA